MDPAQTDWVPALVVLLAAGLVGALLAWRARCEAAAVEPIATSLALRELLARRDSLIDQLRDIEISSPSSLERPVLEREAAETLRAIDAEAAKQRPRRRRAEGPHARGGGIASFASGLASAALIGLLLVFANSAASDRVSGGGLGPTAKPVPGNRISGLVVLDSSVVDVRLPVVVFVFARPEGTTSGPPVVAARLETTSFPLPFSLGPEHSMVGGEMPAKLFVEARVDADGDATTAEPGAPRGTRDGVPLGATGVTLVVR